jgi:hypothetical protein
MRKIPTSCFLLLVVLFAGRAFAQDENKAPEAAKQAEPPVHYYHLDLVVQEVGENGKPVNSRTYSSMVSTARGERDSVRIGSRIPIATGTYSSGSEAVNTQFQYQDVGVNFDVNEVHEVGGKLAMNLRAEVTSLGPITHIGGPNGPVEPTSHHNKWQTPVLVAIGKSTVVFTSDDIDSKGGMQVAVTATLLQ